MSKCKQKSDSQRFCLLHWLEYDQVGVMPEKAMKNGKVVKVGSFVECKWGKKYYEVQILKLSGEFSNF